MSAQDQAALPTGGRSRGVFCRVLRPFIIAMALVFAVPVAADDFADAKRALDTLQYRKAIHLLQPLAERGDARAQHLLGFACMFATGTKMGKTGPVLVDEGRCPGLHTRDWATRASAARN
jgi:hypothetical protein